MYKIVKCEYCKKYSMTSASKIFKCIFCSKSQDITKMRIYFESDSPQVTTKALQNIKREEFILYKGEDGIDDFM